MMRRQLTPALRILAVFTLGLGIVYPMVVTLVAQVVFPGQANGSLVQVGDRVVGSSLIGQDFGGPRYFSSRPSAAGLLASGTPGTADDPVDASDLSRAASGGSNLGPNSEILRATVEERALAYRESNGLGVDSPVPVDAVTASASGVDPHISVANARLQAPRVARTRGMSIERVLQLVDFHTDRRVFGVFGEPGVNVLELNLALDGQG